MTCRLSMKVCFASEMSRKVMGQLTNAPLATCPSMMRLTNSVMASVVYSFKLRDEASTASDIMRMACSRVKGLGPG